MVARRSASVARGREGMGRSEERGKGRGGRSGERKGGRRSGEGGEERGVDRGGRKGDVKLIISRSKPRLSGHSWVVSCPAVHTSR